MLGVSEDVAAGPGWMSAEPDPLGDPSPSDMGSSVVGGRIRLAREHPAGARRSRQRCDPRTGDWRGMAEFKANPALGCVDSGGPAAHVKHLGDDGGVVTKGLG